MSNEIFNNILNKRLYIHSVNEYKGYALLGERLEIKHHTSMISDLLNITALPHSIKVQNPYFYSFLKKLVNNAKTNIHGWSQEQLLLENLNFSCTVNVEKEAEHGQQKHHLFLSYSLDSKLQQSFLELTKNNTNIGGPQLAIEDKNLALERAASVHKSKLAAIGEMSACIGHEINNPLAIAMGNLGFLKNALHDEPIPSNKMNHYLQAIESGLERVQSIVSGLRHLSRDESRESMSEVLTHDLLEVTVLLLREIYARQGVTLQYSPKQTQKSYFVNGHFGELQQVLMNVIGNARDAVLHSPYKDILVSTEVTRKQVIIKITDSGIGISPNEQKKIFNNFYTNKKATLGIGLGLGIVKRILDDHEGSISVKSTVGEGSSFLITLPISNSSDRPSLKNPGINLSREQKSCSPDVHNINAIIIDDEPMLLDVVKSYLESFGMNVVATSSISKVLDEIKKDNHQLLITDLCMPDCDGLQLIEQVKNLATSNIKCVLMTGGVVNDINPKDSSYDKLDGTLKKPFGLSELSSLLRTLNLKRE
jgi:signal transduction histidine kinase/CheY-like chemotaxis protein